MAKDATFKYWFSGLPFVGNTPTGADNFKFWYSGLPYVVASDAGAPPSPPTVTLPALFLAP